MDKEMKLVIPILPGKAEAWRRFLQELEGSRAEEFAVWCQTVGVQVESVLLHDALGGAVAMLTLKLIDPMKVVAHFAKAQKPFERWLFQQVNTLHGLDLSRMNLSASPFLVDE